MGQAIVLTGIVLSAVPAGEYDKRIVLLTKERGKISAFAKGARRPSSQLLAASSPFAFGQFDAYEGKSSYTVVKAEISNYFRNLTTDMEGVCYGFYFLELADYYARENTDELHMLKLLYQSLRALESRSLDNRLVRRIFELKAMVINGEYPNVFSCLNCGKEEELSWLDVKRGGALCQSCGERLRARKLEGSVLYTLQYIITARIEKLYTFAVSPGVLFELEQIMDDSMQFYIDREFHALQILKENEGFAQLQGKERKKK